MAEEGQVDGYVLGRTQSERERLARQAALWSEATERTLTRVRLGPGQSVLDVGCGPGVVMRAMGRMVGPTGRVTGIDVDARLGAETLEALRREGPDIFRFRDLDVTKVDSVDGQQCCFNSCGA